MTEKNANREIIIILWAMLLLSQLVYLFILSALVLKANVASVPIAEQVLRVFAVMAVLICALSLFLPRLLLRLQVSRQKLDIAQVTNLDLPALMKLIIAPLLVRYALLEAICIFGFISAFLSKDVRYFLPYFAVSVSGFLWNFPSERKLRHFVSGISN